MRRTIVFVGPSLPADEVRARLPDASLRGPVAVGDVLALLQRDRPSRIAIVDGYFERMAAVWHKEILAALAAGIEVLGAASMGALRAAELAPFGMIGIGGIYRDFARGTLVADDEVAVAHLPAEYEHQPTSVALVDLRDGIAKAPGLSAATRKTLVELARATFYRERSWERLERDARTAGVPERQLAQLARWNKPSRKARDARALLRYLATTPPVRPPKLRMPRTWAFAQLEALVQSTSSSRSKIPDHRK